MTPAETVPTDRDSASDSGEDSAKNNFVDRLMYVAAEWAEHDIDPETRGQTLNLIALAKTRNADALAELEDAFGGRLAFGTAGLRGPLGAGPKRMNRVVVSQTSAGFAAFLNERAARGETSSPPSIVIGYDGRVNSEVFARDTAEIMAGAGISVTLFPEPGPTPLTAFAVRHLGASAGVMVTASHNPPQDNGYKVYLGDADAGSQIVPPVDGDIAAHIDRVALLPVDSIARSSRYLTADKTLQNAYVAETAAALLTGFPQDPPASGAAAGSETALTIAYTAMHGVGSAIAQRVFLSAGLPVVTPVREQDEPDGAFPTVSFPNPEEPGALDLAFRTARETSAELVVAHDPDADRLAIALPHPEEESGYRRLTGNELGLLLGWRAAERERVRAACAEREPSGTLACTIVSSPALSKVAAEYGLDYAETLSGFKWVSRVPGLLFGYEEALGYLIHPDVVRDKDGISASADAIAMARECKAAGLTVWDLLEQAGTRFGHFASSQVTVRFASMAEAGARAALVRQDPPVSFAGLDVAHTEDLLVPGVAEMPADVLRFDLHDGSRVMIRPSGTEPKLKVYLDTFSDAGSASERRAHAENSLARLEAAVREYLDVGSTVGGSMNDSVDASAESDVEAGATVTVTDQRDPVEP